MFNSNVCIFAMICIRDYRIIITHCILMDFPIYIGTISMGLPIVYFKGSQVEFSNL